MSKFICDNLSEKNGELLFAGVSASYLKEKYGTPLYAMDENKIRSCCKAYKNAVDGFFGNNGRVIYASKACSFKRMCEIVCEEGLDVDCVSVGEIYTCLKAGVPAKKIWFHSNNKTDYDVEYAIEKGVGYFVVDNEEELYVINDEAAKRNIKQNVILRITPGIDPHTFEAVATGKVDSKFGSAIETGQALEITKKTLSLPNIALKGFHSHVGSMCFDSEVFIDSAAIMLEFIKNIRDLTGFEGEILDLGGGYGVRYIESQPEIDIEQNIGQVAKFVKKKAQEIGIALPIICFEPGRSIVASAGLTLYTAGTVKNIPGYKTYVSVDGGMADNPRYALYEAPYTVLNATRLNEENDMPCSVVGRCCESGDIIQENISLPSGTKRGDIIAVCTSGAYQYSMASNYNRLTKPPVVMICDKKDYVAVRRETVEDLTHLDE